MPSSLEEKVADAGQATVEAVKFCPTACPRAAAACQIASPRAVAITAVRYLIGFPVLDGGVIDRLQHITEMRIGSKKERNR